MVEVVKCVGESAVSHRPECVCPKNGRTGSPPDPEYAYDPHDNAYASHPVHYGGALMHTICTAAGSGILLLPYAFHRVGYGVGALATLLVGALYVVNVRGLLAVEYHLCKRLKVPNLTFVGVVDHAFDGAPKALRALRPYLKSLLYLYYAAPLLLAIYLIIIAQYTGILWRACFQAPLSYAQCISYVTMPLMLLCCVPKLNLLVPLSVTTNLFVLAAALIIPLHSFDGRAWSRNAAAAAVGDLNYLPTFFAICLQSLKATGIMLPLKAHMRNPRSLTAPLGVLNVAYAILVPLFGVFGVCCCLTYGAQVRPNILLNLPLGGAVTALVYVLYALALAVSFALMAYVTFDTIWSNALAPRLPKCGRRRVGKYVLRIAIVVFAYVTAFVVPDFTLISAMVGTIGIMLEIALPSTLQLLTLHSVADSPFALGFMVVKNVLIILFATVLFCTSLRDCVCDLIGLYSANSDTATAS